MPPEGSVLILSTGEKWERSRSETNTSSVLLLSTTPLNKVQTCAIGDEERQLSAEVGEDDGLDRHPAHRTQLIPLLQLPRADVAGDEVPGPPVNDAAVLGPRLTDETGVEARLRQPPLRRDAAVQFGDRHQRFAGRRWEELLGVNGGGGLRVGGGGRLGGGDGILGAGRKGGGVGQERRFGSFTIWNIHPFALLHV